MNGLGQPFSIVLDEAGAFDPSGETVRALAGPDGPWACDQFIVVGRAAGADLSMRIWNTDGSMAGACGNASRCVAALALQASGQAEVWIDTPSGLIIAQEAAGGAVSLDMGAPRFEWREIPLALPTNTRESDHRFAGAPHDVLGAPSFVSMGNPHVVFFVEDLSAVDVAVLGPQIETDALFPDRANVGFAQIIARDEIVLRVWERGAGLTAACGTGACAALVAARRRGLTAAHARVIQGGGELLIDWTGSDGHVRMTGPARIEATGWLEV